MDSNFSPAGYVLIGMAVGLILGGLSTYGFVFAWAMRYGKSKEEEEDED